MLASVFALLSILLGALWSFIHLRRQKNDKKLPPGPRRLPIIGNLHMLGKLPHHDLQRLAKKYGPIMSMRFGYAPTIVVSSPQLAKMFLKTHDSVFANRPKFQASEYMSYGTKGLALTPSGPYWRNVRKLCSMELLSVGKIDSFGTMRKEELGLLVRGLKDADRAHVVVDLSEKVRALAESMTFRMIFGCSKDERFDLKRVVQEVLVLTASPNMADYIPFLKVLDLQGLTRRMKATSKSIDYMLEKIIDEHVRDASKHQEHRRDFIDVMLSLKNKSMNLNDESLYVIDRSSIKAIIFDMIVGGSSSPRTVEWALSELIKNPRVMSKLQEELESVVGMERMVEETDLAKLAYLDMVVKETLRLHPPAPLIPRASMEDATINGYYIAKGSLVFINLRAIGRDPDAWSDNADEFSPERFLGSNVDLWGHDFQLIPFGSGRRGCPGMHLGLTTVKIVLAQLVHCFDWKLPNSVSPGDLDLSEVGLSMHRVHNLLALPTYRLC